MQNFVSKCIQSLNSHKSILASNEPTYFEPYKHVDPSSNPGQVPSQNTSYVIGALPSRPKLGIRRSLRNSIQTSSTQTPDQSLEVVMVNSLPTLSHPCNSYPPNMVRKQLRHQCCSKANSDHDLLLVQQTTAMRSYECSAGQSRDDLMESQSGSVCEAESIISHSHSQISNRGESTPCSGRHLRMSISQQDLNVSSELM